VCNFAVACGEVITNDGNFTVCVVSEQACAEIADGDSGADDIYPGLEVTEVETAQVPASKSAGGDVVSTEQAIAGVAPCPSCAKK
jgi:hypothetical protein